MKPALYVVVAVDEDEPQPLPVNADREAIEHIRRLRVLGQIGPKARVVVEKIEADHGDH